MANKISAVMIVKNGEKYLTQVLNSLSKFDEIVVVDNGSTDKTIEILSRYPIVKLYFEKFCGFGPLKNIAVSYASNDWVFLIDSDEVVSSELSNSLLNMTFSCNSVYKVLRRNFYNHHLINGSSWGNDFIVRLYNKNITKFNDNYVHESVILGELNCAIIEHGWLYHFSYNNTSELMNKLEQYADLYARSKVKQKHVSILSLPFRMFFTFFKSYVLQKGFKFGVDGFIVSFYTALGTFIKYLKLYELQHNKCRIITIDVMSLESLHNTVNKINQQSLLPHKINLKIINKKLSIHQINDILEELIVDSEIIASEVNNVK